MGIISGTIILVLAFTIIFVGGLILRGTVKRGAVVGVVLVFILSIFLIYNLFFYYNREQVVISVPSESREELSIQISNRQLEYEKIYSRFVTSLSIEQIAKVTEQTYPNDKIKVSREGIKVTRNNGVVTIKHDETRKFLWQPRNIYIIRAESIGLRISDEYTVDIPFPKKYLNVEGAYKREMNITCGMDELKEFYSDFTNVEIEGRTITIKQKETIILNVGEGKIEIQVERK